MVKTLEIFISSATKDERFLDMLLKTLEGSLKPLEQQGLISFWHERDIKPGAITKQEIQKHLQNARIILLLISADFMALDFCYSDEMSRLIQRQKAGEIHLIPILLRETYWQSAPFSTLKPLPDNGRAVTNWGNQDKAFLNIAMGVKKITDELIATESIKQLLVLRSLMDRSISSVTCDFRLSSLVFFYDGKPDLKRICSKEAR